MNDSNQNYRVSNQKSGFGAVLLIIAGLIFLIGPIFLPSSLISGTSAFMISTLGIVVLIIGAILYLLTKLYIKTPSNMAFVRTGMGGQKVILNGGAIFIPMFHELMEVLTETMKIIVTRRGDDALITKDNLRADVQIEFYIKVEKEEKSVINAATSLGHRGTNPDNLKQLVEEKLVSALRSVAAQSDLLDLHANRQAFAESVQKLVEKDLTPNGLTLETTTCSKLDQADYTNLDLKNIFNAKGARTVAEQTNEAIVAKNDIEKKAEVEIAIRNLETTKQINDLKVNEEQSTAERQNKVLTLQAENESTARKNKAEQERLAREAELASEEKVAVRAQEKEKAVKTAEVQKDQAIEVANLTKEQTVAVQEQEKEKAVQVAQVDKEKTILTKNKEKAVVETEKAEAEAKAAEANQAVVTVNKVAEVNRQKKVTVVNQEAIAETTLINENVKTDVEAYKTKTIAAANKEAAENEAEAITVKAKAGLTAKEFEAKGDEAVKMVPVNVSKAQVEVNAQQVEVTGKELKYKAEFEKISVTLETTLAGINAEKEVGIAFAHSIGEAFSKANMNIWGDGQTVAHMMKSFTDGQGKFIQLKALGNGGDDRNVIREEAKELVTAYLNGQKTAMEVMGAAENVSTEVKSLVQEFITSGGGNTLAGIGLMVKFLTGKDATKADMAKLEKLVAEFSSEK